MKKATLFLSGLLLPLVGMAQGTANASMENGQYFLKLSPNGKYICSGGGDAAIYTLSTKELTIYPEANFGIGNTIADNGMAVASINDKAVLLYNGNTIYPSNLLKYWFCDLNGITRDGTRLTGIINNPGRGLMYVPIVAEVDANGNVSDPVILPYPDKDFLNATPQFASAVWISDDGKTIGGQVLDSMGFFCYPIIYQQDASGNWSYYLPTKDLFNPTGLPIPENPWENEPTFPDPETFMSGALLQAYQEAYQAYLDGGLPEAPVPEEYMTFEEYEKYADAVEKYNDWFYGEQNAMREYIRMYNEILSTSPSFSLNDFAMQPDGKVMAQHGGVINDEDEMEGKIFIFDIEARTYKTIEGPNNTAAPKQILSDGSIIVSRGVRDVPTSWILTPGASEFITMEEYFSPKYPEITEFLEKNCAHGNGIVSASHDLSVWTGGMTFECLTNFNEDIDTDIYYSYILTNLDNLAGIETLVSEGNDGIFRVYNLNGVKLLETKDASQLRSLDKGIYIVNGKKIII